MKGDDCDIGKHPKIHVIHYFECHLGHRHVVHYFDEENEKGRGGSGIELRFFGGKHFGKAERVL